MKKASQYKSNEFGKYIDDRITYQCANVFDVVKELWQEIQELKQDLAMYQEVYCESRKDKKK